MCLPVDEVPDESCDSSIRAGVAVPTQKEDCVVGRKVNLSEVVSISKYSCFPFMVKVLKRVLQFIAILKAKRALRINIPDSLATDRNLYDTAYETIVAGKQRRAFPEVYSYLTSKPGPARDVPFLVRKLNLYSDDHGSYEG